VNRDKQEGWREILAWQLNRGIVDNRLRLGLFTHIFADPRLIMVMGISS